jgi:hypothetical protein
MFNVVFTLYEPSSGHRSSSSAFSTNNQRSADINYKYAWFTRDIHDDIDRTQEQVNDKYDDDSSKFFLRRMIDRAYKQNHFESKRK